MMRLASHKRIHRRAALQNPRHSSLPCGTAKWIRGMDTSDLARPSRSAQQLDAVCGFARTSRPASTHGQRRRNHGRGQRFVEQRRRGNFIQREARRYTERAISNRRLFPHR